MHSSMGVYKVLPFQGPIDIMFYFTTTTTTTTTNKINKNSKALHHTLQFHTLINSSTLYKDKRDNKRINRTRDDRKNNIDISKSN